MAFPVATKFRRVPPKVIRGRFSTNEGDNDDEPSRLQAAWKGECFLKFRRSSTNLLGRY
jgi:hypothetical protein